MNVKLALERQGLYRPAGTMHSLDQLADWVDLHVKNRVTMWVLDAGIDAVFCGSALPAGSRLRRWIHMASKIRTNRYTDEELCVLVADYTTLKDWASTPIEWCRYTDTDETVRQFLFNDVSDFLTEQNEFNNTLTGKERKHHSTLVANIVDERNEFTRYELTCLMLNLGYAQNVTLAVASSAKKIHFTI